MIFLEDTLKRNRDYRSLMDDVERRVFGCGRDESGQFAPKNDCQDDGKGGGGSQPAKSDSWKTSSKDVSLDKKQLQESSPLSDPGDIESLQIGQPKAVAATMSRLGVGSLDDVVAIGGGTIRGAMVSISDLDDEAVTVSISAPVDPSDPQSPRSTATVMLMEGFDGETVADYSDFHPGGNLSDASQQEGGQNSTRRLRVASILKQRMLESLVAAEKTGVSKAVSMAVGKKDDPRVKGYRLWPVFGFDAKVPRSLMAKIPDEMLLRAAGVDIPSQGTGRIPRSVVIKNLRQQVKEVTVQQLMKFRDGENWWTENGGSIELSLDLTDKDSLGYKKFQEELKKLPQLRKRNEGRSWYPIDEYEARSVDCGRVEGGRFGPKNDCQDDGKGGGSTAAKAPSRAKRESWRKSEEENIFLGARELAENSPVIGGERLAELTIQRPKVLADTLDKLGVKDLDTAVKIGGGAIRDAEVRVKPWGGGVAIRISSPVDPEDLDAGSVQTSVDIDNYGDGLEVNYGGLNTPGRVSDAEKLDAGTSDRTRLRIASLMQERMIESLMAAEKAKAVKATTYAAGMKDDPMYSGYRLWPQFGFDAKLDLSEFKVPPEVILASFKKRVPESPDDAAAAAKKLTAKGYTLQQLISTREGKLWWDENGSGTDMTLDLRDKKSLGYKRFAKLKKILPRLKDRNVAEGRSILGWLIEEVTRRSMSLVGFLGGLAGAVERRDCGPSDKDEKGQFTKGNDCQEGAGEGGKEPSKPKAGGGVIWTPGQPAGGVTSRARENPATVRSEDGKEIVSTTIPDAHVYEFAGREWIATVDAGAKLAAEQDEIRGERIDTGKKVISGPEAEYILASITEQARAAMDRGIEPKFYSPEEREEQLVAFSEMIPQVRGGRTKSGAMIEQEDAEHLFRVLQAITSPNASPFINMQRTDSLLQKFFYGDGLVTTSDSLGVTGAGIKKSLRRFQKIVDTLGKRTDGSIDTAAGLRAARELLQGRSLRAGDIEQFFADFASPREKKGTWKPGSYLVDEVVPVFSTFGPKVGPFYGNNNGELEHLTADVWFSRTWGRVTGELVIPGSPAKSAKQAAELAKVIGKASDDQLHGVSAAELSDAIKQTSETGVVSDVLRAWAGSRLRHYARGDYKEKAGTGGQLNRLAKNIVENDTSLIGDPGSGSRRSHMIRLMREASRQTGVSVAYLQDVLWQDEQDAYGSLGAKTATNVGEPSLYSDQIRRLAANNGEDRKRRAKVDRGYRRDYEPPEPFFDDYERGGREQMLWDAALAHLSDEEFANAVIKLAEKAQPTDQFREERRNFAALDAVVEVRAADCGRDDGGKFGDGNTCASGPSNSKGESFRGVRRKSDKTQTKVARKLFQMRVPEKNLKSLVRNLGGKVSNTLVEIDSTKGDEGVNVFVRDRDNNETHYIHIGYYGATVYTTDSVTSQEVSRIQSAAKEFLPKTIDNRLWGAGSEYPVYVVNSPDETAKQWGGLSAKQRLKKERRSADCGRDEGGRFGPKNQCQEDGYGLSVKSEKSADAWGKETYTVGGTTKGNYRYSIKDPDTGGSASLKVEAYTDYSDGDFDPKGTAVTIVTWNATPLSAIAQEGLIAQEKYVGKGFGRRVFSQALEIAKEHDADVISVFGPSDDTLAVLKKYTAAGVISPIESSKAVSGDFYTDYRIDKSKVDEFLAETKRRKKQSRSADCGRDEGGRFGPKNQCQDDGQGGGIATAAKPSSPLDTNENKTWTPDDGDEPFEGASRFSEVRASGGKKVAESLAKTGISPGKALDATGAPDGADIWMRPAPEFSSQFDSPPVMVNFEADVAGVDRGLSGSSVIGSVNGETVIYHSVFDASPSVQSDPAKRHTAARAFYRTMVASVEAARKNGIAEIKFNAAGDSSEKSPSAFRGYTIWPRMGFDAPLPDRIRAKLPESLSHAKSLLDLHATREGTKWWADNGEDIDVSFRVGDRSSPQSKIMDRFIQRFSKERRELPLGTGDDWLSPEDLVRLDEMWQEVWDEGDLDDYEYVEARSADCGRTDDGRFGPKNECQKDGAGVAVADKKGPRSSAGKGLSPKAKQIKQLAAKGASRKQLQAAIEKAIVGKSGLFSGYTPGEASPSEVCRALGIKVANEGDLDELIANSWDYERRGIAAAIAQLSVAQQADPDGLRNSVIRIDTAKSAGKWLGVSRSEFTGVLGAYIGPLGTISIIAGSEEDADQLKRLYDSGYDSTPHPAHTVIHENAHRSHYQEIERRSGIKKPAKGAGHREWDEYQAKVDDLVYGRLSREYHSDYEWASRVTEKTKDISWYATTDPFEAVAEYSTAVRLGYAKNDKDLDRLCRVALAPVPRRLSR